MNLYELHFFWKEACRYCKIAKPIYEEEVRPFCITNGIPYYEWDTADLKNKERKEVMNVKMVPTLIILENQKEVFRADSTTIRDAIKVLQSFLDESF
jgi:glutaredoxin